MATPWRKNPKQKETTSKTYIPGAQARLATLCSKVAIRTGRPCSTHKIPQASTCQLNGFVVPDIVAKPKSVGRLPPPCQLWQASMIATSVPGQPSPEKCGDDGLLLVPASRRARQKNFISLQWAHIGQHLSIRRNPSGLLMWRAALPSGVLALVLAYLRSSGQFVGRCPGCCRLHRGRPTDQPTANQSIVRKILFRHPFRQPGKLKSSA